MSIVLKNRDVLGGKLPASDFILKLELLEWLLFPLFLAVPLFCGALFRFSLDDHRLKMPHLKKHLPDFLPCHV